MIKTKSIKVRRWYSMSTGSMHWGEWQSEL